MLNPTKKPFLLNSPSYCDTSTLIWNLHRAVFPAYLPRSSRTRTSNVVVWVGEGGQPTVKVADALPTSGYLSSSTAIAVTVRDMSPSKVSVQMVCGNPHLGTGTLSPLTSSPRLQSLPTLWL